MHREHARKANMYVRTLNVKTNVYVRIGDIVGGAYKCVVTANG
jgi:hypothetical protein